MSEDTGSQFPEAPQPEQSTGPAKERHPFARAAGGFGCAGLLALVVALLGIPSVVGSPIGFIFLVACGPAAGLLLWGASRNSSAYFSRGALVFGIVSFLVVGTCFMVVAGALK